MLNLSLPASGTGPLRVLCLGAHCDDIEIGCGATLLELSEARALAVDWVIFSSTDERAREARRSAAAFLARATSSQIQIKTYRDGFLPYVGGQVKDEFEQLKQLPRPDVIFTHSRHDLHQDHRLVCELTWNTFRNHLILEYEIPKYDADLGSPNVFVPIRELTAQAKIRHLRESYASQANKSWFTEDLFRSLLRIRGMECNSPTGLAEAYFGRKVVVAGGPTD
jgi:LmbE family N-acetylglucosaminyl deacetylase